jgi:hypothetical protein
MRKTERNNTQIIRIYDMMWLYMFMLWRIQLVLSYQFNMYNTDNHQDGYCLLSSYMVYDRSVYYNGTDPFPNQITEYCLRSLKEKNFIIDFNIKNITDSSYTFSELKQQNITSQMLLLWSASIDLAEQYQIFLNMNSTLSDENEILFYNCTSPLFGPLCQFTFDYNMEGSFDDIVKNISFAKLRLKSNDKMTCYKHLHCQTLLSCLDWHGKNDCLNGFDEKNCSDGILS